MNVVHTLEERKDSQRFIDSWILAVAVDDRCRTTRRYAPVRFGQSSQTAMTRSVGTSVLDADC